MSGVVWSLWLPAAAISLIVVALAALGVQRGALVRRGESGPKREMGIYADQLREIERDLGRGIVSSEEAERLRTETARRLLDADKKAQTELRMSPQAMRWVALGLFMAMPLAAAAFYVYAGAPTSRDMPLAERFAEAQQMREQRLSQAVLEANWASDPSRLPEPQADAQYLRLMAQLRDAIAERPDDLIGNRMLATNERNLGNFEASIAAWEHLVELQGDDVPIEDLTALAETRVQAQGGVVSPEAVVVLERILQRDPEHSRARFHMDQSLTQDAGPDQTLRILVAHELNSGNFSVAADLLVQLIELSGENALVEDMVGLAAAMVQATGGLVSREAEIVLERILQRDPSNGPARYYMGLSLGQTGRLDVRFRLWRGLLEDSAPNAPWVPIIRSEIEQLAQIAGVRYTLPPLETQGLRGPSAEDMAAAADMTEEQRQEMIGSMVEGLSARLADRGGPPEEWARLIGALGVLGQSDRALAILSEARLVFADQPQALATIEAAAARSGGSE